MPHDSSHAIAMSFSVMGTTPELHGQNDHPGFGEALTSFFLLCSYILYWFSSWRLKLTGTVHVASVWMRKSRNSLIMAQPASPQRGTRHSGLAPGLSSNSDVKTLGTSALPSSSGQPGSLTFGSRPVFSFAHRLVLEMLWRMCCALKDVVRFEGAAETADELMRMSHPALLCHRDGFCKSRSFVGSNKKMIRA